MKSAKISIYTTTSLVIASMVGTGIFTSLGFQLVDLSSGATILLLWLLGGVLAYSGALTYAELGSVYPRSGGEYHLLTKIYHPALGFLAGWVSATVGFAAPAALAALAFASYLQPILTINDPRHIAASLVICLGLLHGLSLHWGQFFQNSTTLLKIVLMLAFVGIGFFMGGQGTIQLLPTSSQVSEIFSGSFAIALVFVMYAYTGWNASIYIIGDLSNPQKNLSRSLLLGTALVAVLYILVNYIFLYTTPVSLLTGQLDVGLIVGSYLLGVDFLPWVSMSVSLVLFSTVSSYVFIGPRVLKVIGEDFQALRWLSKVSEKQIPTNAFLFSCILSLLFIYISSFEQVLVYTTFLLILMNTLTVAGTFVVRKRIALDDIPFKSWGYPVLPAFFILIHFWILVYVFIEKPFESTIGVGIMLVGIARYFFSKK